jgi:pre-mRNA-splicing factor SYF1
MTAAMQTASSVSVALINVDNKESMSYEERLIQQPYSVNLWLEYMGSVDTAVELLREQLSSKQDRTSQAANAQLEAKIQGLLTSKKVLAERAVRLLPGSYKLWRFYLGMLLEGDFVSVDASFHFARAAAPDGAAAPDAFASIKSAFERALVRMNKMPRIWQMYLDFLSQFETKITETRRTYDRALQALPAPQHGLIWKEYVGFATGCGVEETAVRVQRRYLAFDPASKEAFAEYLLSVERWGEASKMFVEVIDDETFISPLGSSAHDLWLKLCEVCSKHPAETRRFVDFDGIIRAALSPDSADRDKFVEMQGTLWCKLADYFVRDGEFEKARSV